MQIKDRIVELRRVPVADLRPNPKNWRTHPKAQQDALRGVLAEVGYVDALLARECADGSLMLIDGHLRAETTPDMEVPVLILDVTETEADKILLTFDPLSAMAEADANQLDALLREVQTSDQALAAMLTSLMDDAEKFVLAEESDGEAREVDSRETGLGQSRIKISPVLSPDEISIVEEAIRATGIMNRGEAITEVCRAYVQTERQSDVPQEVIPETSSVTGTAKPDGDGNARRKRKVV